MSGATPCPTPGCSGDGRYAAPGRGHVPTCHHPRGTAMTARGTAGETGLEAPESAHQWAKDHYVVYADFSDDDYPDMGQREATWRDAPTTWGEAVGHLAPIIAAEVEAAVEAAAVRVEDEADRWTARREHRHDADVRADTLRRIAARAVRTGGQP